MPLSIICVLVLNARGDLLLRMDLRPFTMVDYEAAAAEEGCSQQDLAYHLSDPALFFGWEDFQAMVGSQRQLM